MNKLINLQGKHYVHSIHTVARLWRFDNILFMSSHLIFGKPNSTHEQMNESACFIALEPVRISFWMERIYE